MRVVEHEWGRPATHLLPDYDTKFTRAFDMVFAAAGTAVKRVGPRGPNLNAYAKRRVQSVRTECLDHFVICGERHLQHLVREVVAHYHTERPHQGLGNVPLPVAETAGEPQILTCPRGLVQCRSRLGGLLRHYHRAAA